MMYHLAAPRCGYDDAPRFAIFRVRNTTFAEIENQFSSTLLNVCIQLVKKCPEAALLLTTSLVITARPDVNTFFYVSSTTVRKRVSNHYLSELYTFTA
jgi:hypothetical protein